MVLLMDVMWIIMMVNDGFLYIYYINQEIQSMVNVYCLKLNGIKNLWMTHVYMVNMMQKGHRM